MSITRFTTLAAALISISACTVVNPAPPPAASAPPSAMSTLVCAAPLKPAIEHQVYFGRDRGARGEVSEAQWQRFVAEIVAPRFPDGLSTINVAGQSRDSRPNPLLREHTKLLIVVVPAGAPSTAKIDEVATAYRTRFDQRAVFRVDRPVCASL